MQKDPCSQTNKGPEFIIRSGGPWIVETLSHLAADSERMAHGWLFAHEPVTVQEAFTTPRGQPAGTRISFAKTAVDAVQVTLDGTDRGWIWSPDWSVPLTCDLTESEHRLSLELVPGTYNRFGPHQHIDGDRHVVTPDQFAGRKNFTDKAEAPESTYDSDWRFRPFQPPGMVTSS